MIMAVYVQCNNILPHHPHNTFHGAPLSIPYTARFFVDCKSSWARAGIGRRWFHPRNSIVVSGRLKYRNGRQVARGRDIKQLRDLLECQTSERARLS